MTAQDHHRLIFRLIVPEAGWTAMGLRNDALDSDGFILEQRQKLLLPRSLGRISKDIFNANSHVKSNKRGGLVFRPYLLSKSSLSPFPVLFLHGLTPE